MKKVALFFTLTTAVERWRAEKIEDAKVHTIISSTLLSYFVYKVSSSVMIY